MDEYLRPEAAPGPFSAFRNLKAGQECVIILKSGERVIGAWCTSMHRFHGTGKGWLNSEDIDEWWPVGTPKLPVK